MAEPKVLVIVPARGGSKGVPGKNLRPVAGVSLVDRAVVRGRAFVKACGLSDVATVMLDTEDERIAEEGRRWGAAVPFLRPARLAQDDTPTIDSVLFACERFGEPIETVVLLQPTSPLCSARDIAQAAAFCPNGAVYVNAFAVLQEHRAFIVSELTRGVRMPWHRSVDVDGSRICGWPNGLRPAIRGLVGPSWKRPSGAGISFRCLRAPRPMSQSSRGRWYAPGAPCRIRSTLSCRVVRRNVAVRWWRSGLETVMSRTHCTRSAPYGRLSKFRCAG